MLRTITFDSLSLSASARNAVALGLARRERRAGAGRGLVTVGCLVGIQRLVDRRVVRSAVQHEALEQLPAEVGVDLEAVEGSRAVEQPLDCVDVRRGRGDVREGLHELELRVGAGLCLASTASRARRRPARCVDCALLGRDVDAGDLHELRERRADRRRLGLGGDVVRARAARTRSGSPRRRGSRPRRRPRRWRAPAGRRCPRGGSSRSAATRRPVGSSRRRGPRR